ncbi:armadillo-type protein [Mycena latifolia]|nr:armadillo-type protein [Mycena latifolia]
MKGLYHLQALDFVKRNHGVPLKAETIEIYWSYVSWKYVSSSTKIAILKELAKRAESEDEARLLVDSNMLPNILRLVQYPNSKIRHQIGSILSNLASHNSSTAAAISQPLVTLLRDGNIDTQVFGLLALSIITDHELPNGAKAAVEANVLHHVPKLLSLSNHVVEGAEAAVAAKVLDHVAEGLDSHMHRVRQSARELLHNMGRHEDSSVADDAFEAISSIANSASGAEAAVAAQVLDYVVQRLASPATWIRGSACRLIGKLAAHTCTAGAVVDVNPCEGLVSLLRDGYIVEEAFDALSHIANLPDGAEAVVAAKALGHVPTLLASPLNRVRGSACKFVEILASHTSTIRPCEQLLTLLAQVFLALSPFIRNPCERLMDLISIRPSPAVEDEFDAVINAVDSPISTTECAFPALYNIATSQDGAKAVVAAKVLDHVPTRLASTTSWVRQSTCKLLGRLASHEVTVAAVLERNPCVPLVNLL